MDPLIRQAIARIDIMQDGRSVSRGTGALVTDRLVLTALHVVADRAQQPATPLPGTIHLTFPSGNCDAVILNDYMDAQADWVLLECQAPPRVRPVPLGELTETDSAFITYGFPDAEPVDGMVLSGSVSNSAGEIFGVGAIQLFSQEAAAGDGAPVKGLSGAPLIVDRSLVGVIRVSLMKDAKNVAGTLYATPIGPIVDRCGTLLPLPDPCRGLPGLIARPFPNSPFRLLDSFTDKDAEIFFGRNREIRDLYDRLTAPDTAPIVLLYGQSGVGKSSVLDAGVRPRLHRTHDVRYVKRETGSTVLATLYRALTGAAPTEAVSGEQIAAAWSAAEAAKGRPVLVFLDQIDEMYSRPGNETDEDDKLFDALKAVWGEGGKPPAGRLVIAFRKEWLSEIQHQLEPRGLAYEKVFLQGLSREAILAVVRGVTSTRRLQSHFGLNIEAGLPEVIADDLQSDRESPIAPTLQILLSKMWQTASAADRHAPAFTKAMYGSLQRDGLLLGDFLDQQLTRIGAKAPELLSSGLVIDVLAFHTTPLLTAPLRPHDELLNTYKHRAADLLPLLRLCEELYLLTDTAADTATGRATRLAHDTLAPLVRARYDDSVLPGQRARRLLDAHGAEWRNKTGSVLDANDLEIVRQGMTGTRAMRPEEERLIQASEEKRRQEVRNQHRVAMVVRTAAVIIGATVLWGGWNLRLANQREQQLYTTLQAPLESYGWTPEHARRATAGEIAASETAHAELQRLLNAPPPPQKITVLYTPADVNGDVVLQTLRNHHFNVDSGEAAPPPHITQHAIRYGADVTMPSVQQVAYTLIRAGVPVFRIGAFDNPAEETGIIRVVDAEQGWAAPGSQDGTQGPKPPNVPAKARIQALTIDQIRHLGSVQILDPVFGTVNSLGKVGAPIQEAIAARVAIQPFTKGMALWLESDAGSIHVLLDSGAWREYHDSPIVSANDPRLDTRIHPAAAFFNPGGGFRRAWLHYDLEVTLGWPLAPESELQDVTAQHFSNGFMMRPVPEFKTRVTGGTNRILVVDGQEVGNWSLQPLATAPGGSSR